MVENITDFKCLILVCISCESLFHFSGYITIWIFSIHFLMLIFNIGIVHGGVCQKLCTNCQFQCNEDHGILKLEIIYKP